MHRYAEPLLDLRYVAAFAYALDRMSPRGQFTHQRFEESGQIEICVAYLKNSRHRLIPPSTCEFIRG